ncbi:MAG: rhodanese-related sulfurtransferase [Opitutaceae bacterium]|nr:rhodanese-related sulfurtransferase [Opitutaceae bacterium]
MERSSPIVICALYKFVTLSDYKALRGPLLKVMEENGIKGSLLLAQEGINGTVAGGKEGIDALLNWFEAQSCLSNIVYKKSFDEKMPFLRAKVKLKKEIVTMGIEGIDPTKVVGTYVKPQDWNALISDPDVILVDTRNDYECEIGTFKNALNPNITTFREFPQYTKDNLASSKEKKVAMFCTGGIRCEKSTAFLKEMGFKNVFHLEGGILRYLEEVPQEKSLWEGECFVFDSRVAVDHSLEKGSYDQCFACRFPITDEEKKSDKYIQGVSCPRCFDSYTEEQRQRFRSREVQVRLAESRGDKHLGACREEQISRRRTEMRRLKEEQRKASKAAAQKKV